mmetsp:Transcript_10422/g.18751  ORF Transcript_10422/g.18751 Transcript_10422/m.18751 type:complete len:571 (+) Transcript_10422:131-1843(+)
MASVVEKIRSITVASTCVGGTKGKTQDRSLLITAAAVACAVLPFDTFQILFLLCGAIAYAALQSAQKAPSRSCKRTAVAVPCAPTSVKAAKISCQGPEASRYCRPTAHARLERLNVPSKAPAAPVADLEVKESCKPQCTELRTLSAAPVSAPTFSVNEWDGQVVELLGQITPSTDGNKAVQEIAALVQRLLRQLLPEAEVISYASSSFTGRQAFAVAVPEVDIVLNISPAVLKSRLLGNQRNQATDAWKLQKTALRSCVSHLVSVGRFKFRRSAFKSEEPKVTLLAPDSFSCAFGLLEEGIPLDFSINAVTPLCNAALVMECGQVQPRGKDLMLLVKRWAKHRGICHAAKGHLPPYAWSVLCIHFLQAGAGKDGPLLPGVQAFKSAAGLMQDAAIELQGSDAKAMDKVAYNGSAGDLLKAFFSYYRSFGWQRQQVSVRGGQQQVCSKEVPASNLGTVKVCIQDPFDSSRNLAECLTAPGLVRLQEELSRAHLLCTRGASLTELLEPWAPPALETSESAEQSDNEGSVETQSRAKVVAEVSGASGAVSPPWRKAHQQEKVHTPMRRQQQQH